MAYRPAEQKRYADARAQGAANERRNSQFKHGGGPEKTASRRELSDEELFGDSVELSDEELFADDGSPPTMTDAERTTAQAISIWDWPTLGFGEEALSGLSAADTYVRSGFDSKAAEDKYNEEVKNAREIKKRYAAQTETTPGDYAAGTLGFIASIPVGGPLFKGMQGLARAVSGGKAISKIGRGAQNIAALGGTGAVAAEALEAGNAEGSIEDRLNAVGAAGVGPAILGAGLGVAAGGAGAGLTRGAQRVGQFFRGAEDKASRYLAEKLIGAGKTVDDLGDDYAKAAATGKPVALGDVGPQGIKDAGAAAARTPGPGREAAQATIVPRQEGQVARVSDDVGQAVGGKPGTFTQTVDDISAQRAEEAKPLYDRALGSNKPVVSPKIVEITNRPSGKAALQRGLKIAQDEGIPESELVIRNSAGEVVGYSAKALHYMKMGLDDMIESSQRSGDNSAARAFTIMKKELLGEMDRAVPGYADARKAFAGHSANKRAVEQGRQAVNKHPDEIKRDLADMTPGEQDMYRRGYAQKIIEEVERSPDAGNAARRIFGNTAKRERLRAVLGDDEYNRLAEKLGVEDAMYGSYRRTNVGSETAERQAAQTDIDDYLFGQTPGLAGGVAQSFASGTIAPLVRAVGMSGIANLLRGISQRARGHIARMLFSTNPAEVRQALAAIRKEYANAQKFVQTQDQIIGGMAANDQARTATGIAGSHVYGVSPVQPF